MKETSFLGGVPNAFGMTWQSLKLNIGGDPLKVTIVELRYKTKEILEALERKEKVVIMYHGKQKGIIIPASETKTEQLQVSVHFLACSPAIQMSMR